MRFQVSTKISDCYLHPEFISVSLAHACVAEVLSLPLERETLFLYGRQITVPRESLWIADEGCVYRYAGITREPHPWPPQLLELRQLISQEYLGMNSVLVNVYRHGDHYMGYHQDNEPEIDQSRGIFSVSLGQTRDFLLKQVSDKDEVIKISLKDRDGLYMGPETLSHWLHALPKRKRATECRINLTFRTIKETSISS